MSWDLERLKSEERRALVLLGITAILASFYAAMLSTVWSSNGKLNETSFYFNAPAVSSPIRHATFYWMPILQYMIIFWMIYSTLVFVYFSADWLSPKIRNGFHVAATVFMGFYFLYISAFVPLITFIVVWITDPTQQAIAVLLAFLFLSTLEIDFVLFVMTGSTLFIPRNLRRMANWFKSRRASSREPSNQLGV
jgi:hypothetical protein